jgi:hypothetical protein
MCWHARSDSRALPRRSRFSNSGLGLATGGAAAAAFTTSLPLSLRSGGAGLVFALDSVLLPCSIAQIKLAFSRPNSLLVVQLSVFAAESLLCTPLTGHSTRALYGEELKVSIP